MLVTWSTINISSFLLKDSRVRVLDPTNQISLRNRKNEVCVEGQGSHSGAKGLGAEESVTIKSGETAQTS